MLFGTGKDFTMCVMGDGSVVSFGAGSDGKLGHGDESNQLAPKVITALGTDAHECSTGVTSTHI